MNADPDGLDDDSIALAGRQSRVEVYVTSDISAAPHKTGETELWVMHDPARPEGKLYFTQAEWEAFVAGVKDGEFDIDESGRLP